MADRGPLTPIQSSAPPSVVTSVQGTPTILNSVIRDQDKIISLDSIVDDSPLSRDELRKSFLDIKEKNTKTKELLKSLKALKAISQG